MNLSNLKPATGSVKTGKRIGRGPGSGLGGTSTRGHKVPNPDLDIPENVDLKVVKCLATSCAKIWFQELQSRRI